MSPQQQDPADTALQGALDADDALKRKKTGVSKSHMDIQSGYDKALKAILSAQDEDRKLEKQYAATGETWRREVPESVTQRERLEGLKAKLTDRMKTHDPQNALRIADDFKYLAGKGGFSPNVSKAFLDASENLRKAYEGEQLLTKERAPGGALALSEPELASRKQEIEGRAGKLAEEQKTVGQFRGQELKGQIAGVQREKQNVDEYERRLKPAAPTQDDNLEAHISAGGRNTNDLKLAVVGGLRKLEQDHGLELDNLDEKVPFDTALHTILPLLDADGRLSAEMVKILKGMRPQQDRKPTTEGQASQGPDLELEEIRRKQMERREMFNQITNDTTHHTWLSAIAFVLMSMLIGFDKASRLWSRSSRNGTLKPQLDALSAEIREDISIYQESRREKGRMRAEAARQSQRQDDITDDTQVDVYKMILNHQLILQRARASGVANTTTKKMSSDFARYATLADDTRAEIAQQDKILESLTSSDPMKRNAAKIKEDARGKLEQYKAKMREINELLENGGQIPVPAGEEGR